MADPADPADEAQARLDASGIEAEQKYRHYRGGYYLIVATAIVEATLEPAVVYRSKADGRTWVRTLDDFTALVYTDVEYNMPDGSGRMGKPRFQRTYSP